MNNREMLYQEQLSEMSRTHKWWEKWWQSMTLSEQRMWLSAHRRIREQLHSELQPEAASMKAETWLNLTWSCIRVVNKR